MRVEDRGQLERIFQADRETHLYGLADLEEPFWSASEWHMSGEAAVGRVSTGDDWVAGYAMSQTHRRETLDLLVRVERRLPPGALVTGPLGLHEQLSRARRSRSLGVHWRMILDELHDDGVDGDVQELSLHDMEQVIELHSSAPGETFFLPSMLSHGLFVGVEQNGKLVASAGTHAMSEVYSVAAVGAVITHPSYRGLGLGRLVVAALCRRLAHRCRTIGLNVSVHNHAAVQLYEGIGFERVFDYEEVELW